MSNRTTILGILVVGVLFLGSNALYIVNEMERAVLLRLGKVVNPDVETGLHFKVPFVEEVRKFDARVLTVDAPAERFLTLEKKALIVDSFAKFQVQNLSTRQILIFRTIAIFPKLVRCGSGTINFNALNWIFTTVGNQD